MKNWISFLSYFFLCAPIFSQTVAISDTGSTRIAKSSLKHKLDYNSQNTYILVSEVELPPYASDLIDQKHLGKPQFSKLTDKSSNTTSKALPGCEIDDRNALIAIYNATDGPNWINNTNWNTAAPLDTWYGVKTNANGCVTVLDMNPINTPNGGNGLKGMLPNELGDLSQLQTLDLSYQNFSGPIPDNFGNLTELVQVDITGNQLTNEIPASIGNLSKLQILMLANNQLSGNIPNEIGNLSSLRYLLLYANELTGPLPNTVGNLSYLKIIWLYQNDLNGTLPTSLTKLRDLEQLLLSSNRLSGTIPDFWTNFPKLKGLWLGYNAFIGQIPNSMSSMRNLEQLHLNDNQLTGSIPTNFGNLGNLRSLWVGDNPLTGIIPAELGNLTSLESLTIYRTKISGTLPPELGNLRNLEELWLAFNELTTGTIPSSYANLVNLRQLALDDNYLTGNIPTGFDQFTDLESFSLSNNYLEGPIPDFSNSPLDILQFENNKFQFGDFENQFDHYSTFSFFYDSPQAKVDDIENLNHNLGDRIIFSTTVSGTQNHYQWFKDGVLIAGAPDSPKYEVENATAADAGVYHCIITSDIVTDLILERNDINLTISSCVEPVADSPNDIFACESYVLPELTAKNHYFTEKNGGGSQLKAGDIISETQSLFIFSGTDNCYDENLFTITIYPFESVDVLKDAKECSGYILPELTNGNYFTDTGGKGTELSAGDTINQTGTIYIYASAGSCYDESNFHVAIDSSICQEQPTPLCYLEFPKFFTPNDDGRNDRFKLLENQCAYNGVLNIYDRYGKLLYRNENSERGWDGTFRNKPLPSTDYWYRFVNSDSGEILTGHFTLKR